MKKVIVVLLMMVCLGVSKSYAGEGNVYVNFGGGWQYRNTLTSLLALEFETRYHSAWEFNVNISNEYRKCPIHGVVDRGSFWYKQSYTVGGAYKGRLMRWKNSTLKYRLGVDFGAEEHAFQLGLGVGLEYNYTFKNKMKLFVLQKNDFRFWAGDTFRNGLLVGIKIPIR